MTKPHKLPRNALLILRKTKFDKFYTKNDIIRLTSITRVECNYAIRCLRETGLIEQVANLIDTRKKNYHFLSAEQIKSSESIPDQIKQQLTNILIILQFN